MRTAKPREGGGWRCFDCADVYWERKRAEADADRVWCRCTGRTRQPPEDIVGSVDPASMRETDEGLVVKGQLDLEGSERARQAWRAMKTGSIGLSLGYLTQEHRKAADGANELTALDVFEISLAPGRRTRAPV